MIGLLLVLLLLAPSWAGKGRVLMVIAPEGFRDEELKIPKVLFEEAGLRVVVASVSTAEAKGMLGMRVKPDVELSEVDVADYDAVVFVGGIGSRVYFADPQALRIAREAVQRGKVLGAICLAPVILARAGVLKGKRATVWPSEGKTLQELGANYTARPVEVDDRVVTANGPQAAEAFAQKILQLVTR